MGRVAIVCTVCVLVAAGLAHALRTGSAPAPAATSTCGASCVAAYRAIAGALPTDRTQGLARAILAAPGFDYSRLARTLGVPTTARLRVQWRRRCRSLFPGDRRRAYACFLLILPSTYAYLDGMPA